MSHELFDEMMDSMRQGQERAERARRVPVEEEHRRRQPTPSRAEQYRRDGVALSAAHLHMIEEDQHDADESFIIEMMLRQYVPDRPSRNRAIQWLQGFQRAAGWRV